MARSLSVNEPFGVVMIAKSFNEDMDEYLARIYGKKERSNEVKQQPSRKSKPKSKPKPKKQKEPEKVPDEVKEDEVFVEYDDAKPGANVFDWLADAFSGKSRKEEVPDDLPQNEAKVLEDMEHEVEETDEQIQDLEKKRDSLWTRFLKSMRSSRGSSEDEEESGEDSREQSGEASVAHADEDVKEVLKLVHGWLEQLPHGKLNEFKQSDDFRKYKAVLEKYGLIKRE